MFLYTGKDWHITGSREHFPLVVRQLCFSFVSMGQIRSQLPKKSKEIIIHQRLSKVCFVQNPRDLVLEERQMKTLVREVLNMRRQEGVV